MSGKAPPPSRITGTVPVGECVCKVPIPHPSPYRHTCVRCGYAIAERWESNDANLAAFFDRLEETFPSWPTVPEWWQRLRLQCEARELAGRRAFGLRYLDRDNIRETREEIADAVLYPYFHQLAEIRHGEDVEIDVLLDVVQHLGKAFAGLDRLTAKHRGAP